MTSVQHKRDKARNREGIRYCTCGKRYDSSSVLTADGKLTNHLHKMKDSANTQS